MRLSGSLAPGVRLAVPGRWCPRSTRLRRARRCDDRIRSSCGDRRRPVIVAAGDLIFGPAPRPRLPAGARRPLTCHLHRPGRGASPRRHPVRERPRWPTSTPSTTRPGAGTRRSLARPGNREYQTARRQRATSTTSTAAACRPDARAIAQRATTASTSATWHLIALNSNCSAIGGCGAGSAQELWLRADLAANPRDVHPRLLAPPVVQLGRSHGNNSFMPAHLAGAPRLR